MPTPEQEKHDGPQAPPDINVETLVRVLLAIARRRRAEEQPARQPEARHD